jgi:hypothetical protein
VNAKRFLIELKGRNDHIPAALFLIREGVSTLVKELFRRTGEGLPRNRVRL